MNSTFLQKTALDTATASGYASQYQMAAKPQYDMRNNSQASTATCTHAPHSLFPIFENPLISDATDYS